MIDVAIYGIMALAGLTSQLVGAGVSAGAAKAEAAEASRNLRLQALLSNRQAMDAVRRGQYEAGLQRMKGSLAIGAQRAAAGASGVDSSSGTAAAVYEDTRAMAELDALTTANNAAREAWGYQVQATQAEKAAQVALQRGAAAARTAMVKGGLGAAESALTYAGKLGTPGGPKLPGSGG